MSNWKSFTFEVHRQDGWRFCINQSNLSICNWLTDDERPGETIEALDGKNWCRTEINLLRARSAVLSRDGTAQSNWMFPHCAFVASWLTDYCMAFLWLWCSLLFSLPYQSLRSYNAIISSNMFQTPLNWSADHRPCWFLVCFLGVFVCFVWFLGFCCLLFCFRTVTAQWIMYRAFSVLFCTVCK